MTGRGGLNGNSSSIGFDWWTVGLYLVLVLLGWINIYAASYDESHASIFDMSRNYGKQVIWMAVSFFLAISVLLIDDKYYYILAYPLYGLTLLALLGTFVLGTEVNGARAWYDIGSVRIQPTEFMKFSTALVVARAMSAYSFNIHSPRSVLTVTCLFALPMFIIAVLQNDMGSALVYASFTLVLFREGFNGWLFAAIFILIVLFVLSFWFEPLTLLIMLILACTVTEGIMNGRWKSKAIYLAGTALLSILIWMFFKMAGTAVSIYTSLLTSVAISTIAVIIYAYRHRLRNVLLVLLIFFGSLGFTSTVDYVFDNMLKLHQQKRILLLLGMETDNAAWGYNVNQSKIAIGSGGLTGKGFLQGTQTRYDFVPEQSTDFIFCTVGEEWGFLGSVAVIILFAALIIRLVVIGDRQKEAFRRVYCYCAASIFLFHFVVNTGMTIGIMPVIGIPLPFFSYGGSSMIAFTLLLFTAIKLDNSKDKGYRHL